tara:strand:- start:73 stop:180 length:108 start_codon:yes stop_codon:yes gene_type:complete
MIEKTNYLFVWDYGEYIVRYDMKYYLELIIIKNYF